MFVLSGGSDIVTKMQEAATALATPMDDPSGKADAIQRQVKFDALLKLHSLMQVWSGQSVQASAFQKFAAAAGVAAAAAVTTAEGTDAAVVKTEIAETPAAPAAPDNPEKEKPAAEVVVKTEEAAGAAAASAAGQQEGDGAGAAVAAEAGSAGPAGAAVAADGEVASQALAVKTEESEAPAPEEVVDYVVDWAAAVGLAAKFHCVRSLATSAAKLT